MPTEVQEAQEAIAAHTPPASNEPAPAPAPAPAADPPAPASNLDPDAQALADVRAEIAAQGNPTPAPDTPAPAAASPAATPAPATPPSPPRMVPAAALLAERRRAQEAERQAAELSGQVSVLQRLVPNAAPELAAPAAPAAPVDRVAEIDTEIDALAERFDRGDITMLEYKRQERALQSEQADLRQQREQQTTIRTDTSLAEHGRQLAQQYPAVVALNDAQVAALTDMAYAEAALEGKPIGVGVEATKELRTRIAVLAQSKFGQPAQGAPASPAAPAPLSRNAQANALAIANATSAPPDVSRMGTATTAVTPPDAEVLAKLDQMTDDEANAYLNSMPGLRAKIRGV